jgi:hypothetical protein
MQEQKCERPGCVFPANIECFRCKQRRYCEAHINPPKPLEDYCIECRLFRQNPAAYLVIYPEITIEQHFSVMTNPESKVETMTIFHEKQKAVALAEQVKGFVIELFYKDH